MTGGDDLDGGKRLGKRWVRFEEARDLLGSMKVKVLVESKVAKVSGSEHLQ